MINELTLFIKRECMNITTFETVAAQWTLPAVAFAGSSLAAGAANLFAFDDPTRGFTPSNIETGLDSEVQNKLLESRPDNSVHANGQAKTYIEKAHGIYQKLVGCVSAMVESKNQRTLVPMDLRTCELALSENKIGRDLIAKFRESPGNEIIHQILEAQRTMKNYVEEFSGQMNFGQVKQVYIAYLVERVDSFHNSF